MRTRKFTTVICLAVVVCATRFSLAVPFLPDFSQTSFSDPLQIDNQYWPMVPGTIWTYEGVSTDPETGETENETIIVSVTHDTRDVAGVATRVVRDEVWVEDVLIEDTWDWYAQDDTGNIWYMGEDVSNFNYDEDGNLIDITHEGAWEAGVDGALPGWMAQANPQVGDNYYQEFYVGNALDEATVLALGESVTVPAGTFDNTQRTLEGSVMFPETGQPSWAPGVGPVRELDFDENGIHVGTLELVSVVPEPGSIVLLALGSLGLLARLRPRRRCV